MSESLKRQSANRQGKGLFVLNSPVCNSTNDALLATETTTISVSFNRKTNSFLKDASSSIVEAVKAAQKCLADFRLWKEGSDKRTNKERSDRLSAATTENTLMVQRAIVQFRSNQDVLPNEQPPAQQSNISVPSGTFIPTS